MERQEAKKQMEIRLKRIEGQIKGVYKMVDEDASCKDILIQIAAVRAALGKVGTMILGNYAEGCFKEYGSPSDESKIDELIETLTMFMK